MTARARQVVVVLLPALLVLLVEACLLGTWVIDDAGICDAYARNLATGHGLTAQAGVPPVEGYSDPLWVFLLAGCYALHLFDPVLTPKVLGIGLAAASFAVFADASFRHSRLSPLAVAVILLLTALQPAFAIWTVAGLENPLYLLLIVLCFALTLDDCAKPSVRRAVCIGAAAAAAGMTRPDGALYALLYPAVMLASVLRDRYRSPSESARPRLVCLAAHLGAWAVLYGGFIACRWLYFHDVVPNTFWAKAEQNASLFDILTLRVEPVAKLLDLTESAIGLVGRMLLPVLVGFSAWLATRGRMGLYGQTVLATAAAALLAYLILADDWMGEYRFAYPFYLFAYAALVQTATEATASFVGWRSGRGAAMSANDRRVVCGVLPAAAVLLVASYDVPRLRDFAKNPPVPLSYVSATFGERYNAFAAVIQGAKAPAPSVLAPDLGGMLLVADLRIYDLAGLCDREIAHAIHDNDSRRFGDYIFEEARPTFIHLHMPWDTRVRRDPRLERDYLLIGAVTGGPGDGVFADYVRRDVLSNSGQMQRLQQIFRDPRWQYRFHARLTGDAAPR